MLLAFTGCTDPQGRFDEFGTRIVDASNIQIDAEVIEELPDITGRFLLGISPVVMPDRIMQFIADVEMTDNGDGTAVLDITFTPLTVADRTPIGDPLSSLDVAVANTGEFTAPVEGIVPGPANPISGSEIELDGALEAVIKSTDLFCGDVTGRVSRPTIIDLDGSTGAGIRVPPEVVGDDLPTAQWACPEDMPVDAGVPDAALPDAS
jgi:hypothetical protein